MFKEYAVPYLQKAVAAVHRLGLPVIIHICGDLSAVKSLLIEMGADVISVDAVISLKKLKEEFPALKPWGISVPFYWIAVRRRRSVSKPGGLWMMGSTLLRRLAV